MPECDICHEAHATVATASWVNDGVDLCPGCWDQIKQLASGEAIRMTIDSGPTSPCIGIIDADDDVQTLARAPTGTAALWRGDDE